ncbi:MAG: hypothetical protein U9Q74_14660 [Gemmatimonadota bacterium]|nr:hypothetical protein [Gemmatimonadota bacterium]
MPQFVADIAGMLEIMAVAGGIVLLHRAGKDAAAGLLRLAGWILVVGGIAVGACTTYYWFQYRSQGAFQTAHMMAPGQMMPGVMGASGMAGMTPGGATHGAMGGAMRGMTPGAPMQPGVMGGAPRTDSATPPPAKGKRP